MGKYNVEITKKAKKELIKLKKSGKKSDINKVALFFQEISKSPRQGVGNPEQLKYSSGEVWSRRINKKDRFVYRIYENKTIVVVLSSLGHYET